MGSFRYYMHSTSRCSYVAASGIIEVYLFRHCFIMYKDGMSVWDRLRCFILKVIYFFFVISVSVQVADACDCGNEPSGSVKCGEFLD